MDNNTKLAACYLARAEYYETHASQLRAEGLTDAARDEEDTARDFRLAIAIVEASRMKPVVLTLDVRGGT